MIFYGEPNKYAVIKTKYPVTQKPYLKRLFRFDGNGRHEYHGDAKTAECLKRMYKYTDAAPDEVEINAHEGEKIYKCKQCPAEFDAPWKLAQHVRKEHPKGDK